jgi:putative methionine-R-sulfoxide reductase with GAF domain
LTFVKALLLSSSKAVKVGIMESKWLETGDLGVETAGWYVVEDGEVLVGPYQERKDADCWIVDNTPEYPVPDSPGLSH